MDLSSAKKLNNNVMIPWLGLGVFQANPADTFKSVSWALEAGYRHIDTASFYGNEADVGKAVKQSGIKRSEVFVTTKLWNDDMRANRQRQAFEQSMQALGFDYIDLYLIHWPVENFIETWQILEDIYHEGLIRAIGVSNFQISHLQRLLERAKVVPAVNQIESHPRLTQKPLLAFCEKAGIACEAWSPLGGQGAALLKEKPIASLADKYDKTPAQIILRWDLQRGVIPLPKSVHQERIISNARIFDFTISNDDMDVIDAMNQDKRFGADPDNFNF